eukprot:1114260-Prorocentrum_minimum.AAC.1
MARREAFAKQDRIRKKEYVGAILEAYDEPFSVSDDNTHVNVERVEEDAEWRDAELCSRPKVVDVVKWTREEKKHGL